MAKDVMGYDGKKYINNIKHTQAVVARGLCCADLPYAVIARLRRSNPGQSETAPVSICKIDKYQSIFLFKSIYIWSAFRVTLRSTRGCFARRLAMTAFFIRAIKPCEEGANPTWQSRPKSLFIIY